MKKNLVIAVLVVIIFLGIGAFFTRRAYHRYMTIEAIFLDPKCTIYLGGGGNSFAIYNEILKQCVCIIKDSRAQAAF